MNIVNIDAKVADEKGRDFLKKMRNGQRLLKLAQRKSIMTMAAPGFYMYPVVMSGGIETSQQMEIAKAFQVTYASSVATAYSLHGDMDRRETPQVADFVKKFHQNDPKLINANLNAIGTALGLEGSMTIEEAMRVGGEVESAVVMENALTFEDSMLIDLFAWNNVKAGLCMESLNDIYQPFKRTQYKLNQRLQMMKEAREASIANEAGSGFMDKLNDIVEDVNFMADGKSNRHNATATMLDDGKVVDTKYDKDGNKISEKTTFKKRTSNPVGWGDVKRSITTLNLEPTMVNVQVVAHGKGDTDGNTKASIHNVSLCIKAMPRIVNSSIMIAAMVEACQNSHAIFKFLKWTKEELNTFDKVLGITASKRKAIQRNAKNEVKFLEQSRKRKKKGLFGRFVRNEVLPTTTVVITAFEAEKIKEICGVDLNRYEMAVRLMNKYYLLGFCIYDTEQETMKVLFDADTDWGTTSFQSMSNAVGNVKDVLNQNDTLRLFGRK